MIISAYQAEELLKAHNSNKKNIDISLDIGNTKSNIEIKDNMFIFPDKQSLSLDKIKKIIKKDTMCFFIENNDIVQIAIFSEETNNYYKLVPAKDWPTIEISGIRMHVTKAMSPKEDTEKKISFVLPCIGKVLDTCTGLGYTAINAGKTAEEVHTFERDSNVIELEKINPWSQELFENKKIIRHHEDVFNGIKKINSNYFDRVIHDPPRQALSNLLYSQEFYNELFRVLKKGGKLFHYTGDPGSKRGLDIRAGITKRLSISRFSNIQRVFNGLTAEKSS
jgi:uncharacterized protein